MSSNTILELKSDVTNVIPAMYLYNLNFVWLSSRELIRILIDINKQDQSNDLYKYIFRIQTILLFLRIFTDPTYMVIRVQIVVLVLDGNSEIDSLK